MPTGRPAGAVEEAGAAASALPLELITALGELFTTVKAHVERVVQPLDLPAPCGKALHMIDGSVSMKELGSRMHCDGSFVTAIADTLEGRGLVRREIDPSDRRIKNLVLTPEGAALRAELTAALCSFPGFGHLDEPEREELLALLRKMCSSDAAAGVPDCAV